MLAILLEGLDVKVYGVPAHPLLVHGVAGAGVARMADALTLHDVEVERLGDDVAIIGYTHADRG